MHRPFSWLWRIVYWLAWRITLFAWRRFADATPKSRMPTGVPFNRDPKSPCSLYEPRDRQPGDYGDCEGDGHYLCRECCHLLRTDE